MFWGTLVTEFVSGNPVLSQYMMFGNTIIVRFFNKNVHLQHIILCTHSDHMHLRYYTSTLTAQLSAWFSLCAGAGNTTADTAARHATLHGCSAWLQGCFARLYYIYLPRKLCLCLGRQRWLLKPQNSCNRRDEVLIRASHTVTCTAECHQALRQ
jgi:hypothetical protein